MATATEKRSLRQSPLIVSWLPLAFLPLVVLVVGLDWPAWIFMWALSLAIYAGLKWLTFADSDVGPPTIARMLAYLMLWPGMDAKSFLDPSRTTRGPKLAEWVYAVIKLALGVALIIFSKSVIPHHPLVGGWIGMSGIVFALHFGLMHVLSNFWREAGIHAAPIMNAPCMASSLSDFWGRRWNLAFRDLAHTYVFRPYVGSLGAAGATMAVFFVSGVIHDLVISAAARAGYGWPTLYFIVQGFGLLFERSRIGRRLGLGKGVTGRLYCAVIVLGPVGMLFHRPFVEHVVIPMLRAF